MCLSISTAMMILHAGYSTLSIRRLEVRVAKHYRELETSLLFPENADNIRKKYLALHASIAKLLNYYISRGTEIKDIPGKDLWLLAKAFTLLEDVRRNFQEDLSETGEIARKLAPLYCSELRSELIKLYVKGSESIKRYKLAVAERKTALLVLLIIYLILSLKHVLRSEPRRKFKILLRLLSNDSALSEEDSIALLPVVRLSLGHIGAFYLLWFSSLILILSIIKPLLISLSSVRTHILSDYHIPIPNAELELLEGGLGQLIDDILVGGMILGYIGAFNSREKIRAGLVRGLHEFFTWSVFLFALEYLIMYGFKIEELSANPLLINALTGSRALNHVTLMLLVLGAPIFEEAFYRALIHETLKGYGVKFAIRVLISSSLFALLHSETLSGFAILLFLGALLGTLYEIYGNIWVTVGFHGLWNGVSFILLSLSF